MIPTSDTHLEDVRVLRSLFSGGFVSVRKTELYKRLSAAVAAARVNN